MSPPTKEQALCSKLHALPLTLLHLYQIGETMRLRGAPQSHLVVHVVTGRPFNMYSVVEMCALMPKLKSVTVCMVGGGRNENFI